MMLLLVLSKSAGVGPLEPSTLGKIMPGFSQRERAYYVPQQPTSESFCKRCLGACLRCYRSMIPGSEGEILRQICNIEFAVMELSEMQRFFDKDIFGYLDERINWNTEKARLLRDMIAIDPYKLSRQQILLSIAAIRKDLADHESAE